MRTRDCRPLPFTWLSTFGTPDRPRTIDGHALWPGPKEWLVLNALIPAQAAFLLLCPKTVPAEWWYSSGLQKEVGFLYAPFPADPRLTGAVRLFGRAQAKVLFVGDMDPVAVAQYLAAKRMFAADGGPQLVYAGINDAWLAAIGRSRWPPARLSIRLERPEMRLLRALDSEVRLDALVGPNCASLLRGGSKMELEAGLNPGIHRPSHKRWVLNYLRSVAAGITDGKEARASTGPAPQV